MLLRFLVPGVILELTSPVMGADLKGKKVSIHRLRVVASYADGRIETISAEDGKFCLVTLRLSPASSSSMQPIGENRWIN